ncbi:MAG: ABC transporter ATP-binding protein [Ardenticatenales bacterium]|nr:ABC transporter ATP-binding protein [Ardenticatenales bacterium]
MALPGAGFYHRTLSSVNVGSEGTVTVSHEHIVELIGVQKFYPGLKQPTIDDLSLTAYRGEILALLGPSGCGKTTTLRLIAGFEVPDTGMLLIDNKVVAGAGRWLPPEKRGLGVVFQEYALFPHYTVEQNVGFGLHQLPRHARAARVQEVLELVSLGEMSRRYPHELSGGQQQRVALARALAPKPVVVLLDEPFSNLDADLRVQMRTEVKRILREAHSTAIFVTHDQEEALCMGDRVAIMNQGRLEQVDIPESVFHTPATRFVADFLGLADFIPGVTTTRGLDTELGLIPQPAPGILGRALEVMIRPHDVMLHPDHDGPGKVIRREFYGAENLYVVQLPSGSVVRSSQPHTVSLPLGARVRVLCEPGHALTCFEGEHAVLCPQECDLPGLAHPRAMILQRK